MARMFPALGSVWFALVGLACGGGEGSEFGEGGDVPGKGTTLDVVETDPSAGSPGTLDPSLQACATAVTDGQVAPVNLIIMFDKSGSMAFPDEPQQRACKISQNDCGGGTLCLPAPGAKDGLCADLLVTKWAPAKEALVSFLGDASSANMKAALNFFPKGNGDAEVCASKTYDTASSPVALPSTAFGPILGAVSPGGSTPTLPALAGALENAKRAVGPGEKAVVVLVTDGRPTGCNSTPETVSAKAREYAASVPTYVVGVGLNAEDNQNLDLIAASGGTGKAIRVSTGNTKGELVSALNAIRGQVASCSLLIPSPPIGKTIDFKAVNVSINGSAVPYSKDCSAGAGWHYDDAANPKRIDLCQASCDASKGFSGKVSLAFGCATKGGVIL